MSSDSCLLSPDLGKKRFLIGRFAALNTTQSRLNLSNSLAHPSLWHARSHRAPERRYRHSRAKSALQHREQRRPTTGYRSVRAPHFDISLLGPFDRQIRDHWDDIAAKQLSLYRIPREHLASSALQLRHHSAVKSSTTTLPFSSDVARNSAE